MGKRFAEVYDKGNLDHPEFIKKTNKYEGVQYYFKALKFKDEVRVLMETPNPLEAKRFSLRDIIQMTFTEMYDPELLKKESDLNNNYIENFLSGVSGYLYVDFPALENSYWSSDNKEAARAAIKEELARRTITLEPNPKKEEESE